MTPQSESVLGGTHVRLRVAPVTRLENIKRREFASIIAFVLAIFLLIVLNLSISPGWNVATYEYALRYCQFDVLRGVNNFWLSSPITSCNIGCWVAGSSSDLLDTYEEKFGECQLRSTLYEGNYNLTPAELSCPYDGVALRELGVNITGPIAEITLSWFGAFSPTRGTFDASLSFVRDMYELRPTANGSGTERVQVWDGLPFTLRLNYSVIVQGQRAGERNDQLKSIYHKEDREVQCGPVGTACETLLLPGYALGYNECANLKGYHSINLQILYRAMFSPLQPSLNSTSIGTANNTQLIPHEPTYATAVPLNQASMLYTTTSDAFAIYIVSQHIIFGSLMIVYTIVFARLAYVFEQAPFSAWLVERKWALVQCVCACLVISDPVYYLALTDLVGERNPHALTIFIAVDEVIVNLSIGVIFFLNLCFLDSFGSEQHTSIRHLKVYASKLAFLGVWVVVVGILCVNNVVKEVQTYTSSLMDALRPWARGITYAMLSYYFLTLLLVWYKTSAALKGEWNYRARHRQLGFRMMVVMQLSLIFLIFFETLFVPVALGTRQDVFKFGPYTGFSLLFFSSIGTNVYIVVCVFALTYCYLPPHDDGSAADDRTCADILHRSSYVRGSFSLYTANAMCSSSRLAYRYMKLFHQAVTDASKVSKCGTEQDSGRMRDTEGFTHTTGVTAPVSAPFEIGCETSANGCGIKSHSMVRSAEALEGVVNNDGVRNLGFEGSDTICTTKIEATDEQRGTNCTTICEDEVSENPSSRKHTTDKDIKALSNDSMPVTTTGAIPFENNIAPTLWDDIGRTVPPILQTHDYRKLDTDFEVLEYITDERTDTHCIIYRQDGHLIITFRGTVSAGNAATDMRANLIPICSAVEKKALGKARFKHSCSEDDSECRRENVRVHRGFQTAFVSVRARVIAQVRAQIALHTAQCKAKVGTSPVGGVPPNGCAPATPNNIQSPLNNLKQSCSPPPYPQPLSQNSGLETPLMQSVRGLQTLPCSDIQTYGELLKPSHTEQRLNGDESSEPQTLTAMECDISVENAAANETLGTTLAHSNQQALHIFVTGHSLGAALCTLCAYELSHTFTSSELDMTVYTFGSPRVGNANFVHHYNKRLPHTHRIVNDGDPVTSLPKFKAPGFLNITYKHVGKCYVLAEMGDLIVDPNFPERLFQLKAKRKPVTHRMLSYRTALVECITRMHQRANGGGVSYGMERALTVMTEVLKAHIAWGEDKATNSKSGDLCANFSEMDQPIQTYNGDVDDDALMVAAFAHGPGSSISASAATLGKHTLVDRSNANVRRLTRSHSTTHITRTRLWRGSRDTFSQQKEPG